MANINAFTGVGVAAAGMSWTLHAAAHPAHAAAAIAPRKRRFAAATRPSVDWGTI